MKEALTVVPMIDDQTFYKIPTKEEIAAAKLHNQQFKIAATAGWASASSGLNLGSQNTSDKSLREQVGAYVEAMKVLEGTGAQVIVPGPKDPRKKVFGALVVSDLQGKTPLNERGDLVPHSDGSFFFKGRSRRSSGPFDPHPVQNFLLPLLTYFANLPREDELREKLHTLVAEGGHTGLINRWKEVKEDKLRFIEKGDNAEALRLDEREDEMRAQLSELFENGTPQLLDEGYALEMIGYICQNL